MRYSATRCLTLSVVSSLIAYLPPVLLPIRTSPMSVLRASRRSLLLMVRSIRSGAPYSFVDRIGSTRYAPNNCDALRRRRSVHANQRSE